MSSDLIHSHRSRPWWRVSRFALAAVWALVLATRPLPAQEPLPPGFEALEVRNTSAAEIAGRVQQLVRDGEPTAEVLVDRSANRLLVRGTDSTRRLAAQLVQTLDRPSTAPPAEPRPQMSVRGYTVTDHLRELQQELEQRYGGIAGVRIAADERTSQLVVVAPLAIQNEIAQRVARPLTVAPPPPMNTPAIPNVPNPNTNPALRANAVVLRQISWQDFERYLHESFGERLQVQEEQGGQIALIQVPTSAGEPTMLRIDRLSNAVYILGSQPAQQNWRQVIQALDYPARAEDAAKMVSLRNADPLKVQQAVASLKMTGERARQADTTATIPVPAIRDPRLFAAAQEQPGANQPAEAQPLQPQPDQPMPDQPPGTQPAEGDEDAALLGDVRIEFVPELGVIVIRGPRRAVERVRRIIAEIEDQAKLVQPEVEIVPLEHVNSQALATLIIELYDEVFAPRQGPLSITSLDKPNALLLIGRKETMEVVKQLIVKLDQPVPASTQLKAFQLKNISAIDAERLVQGFFVNQPGGTGAGAAGSGELRPALGTRARVIADYRSNSLIVQASIRDLEELALFIESIDRESPEATHEIKIFRLQNALATDLAPILQAAIAGTVAPTQQGAGGQPAPAAQGASQVTAPSTKLSIVGVDSRGNRIIDSGVLTDVTVSADPNVNALVIRAPARSMNLVEELIKQLDLPPNAVSQVKVFQIENGDATSLQTMLQTLFGLQATGAQGGAAALQPNFGALAGTATAAGSESPLIPLRFAVDIRTNSIIATGSAGDLGVVEVLLLRLDEADINTRKMFVYRLKNAPAQDVANSITSFLTSQRQIYQQNLLFQQSVSQIEQLERDIIVVPELVSNSLIVSVTPRYENTILDIIEDLDFRPAMVMVQVMICEVTLTDAFEFGVELGLQDSLLFDRTAAGGSATIPATNASTVTSATRERLAGQSLSTFGLGRTSATLGYGGMVLAAANESVNILIRALQDAGRLQILSRPQVMTLNNQVAFVQVGARVPRVTGSSITNGIVQNQTQDVDVGLLLRIQPRINEDGLVVMNIDAEKSEVGPLSTAIPVAVNAQGDPILSPQILTTTAQTTISAHNDQTVVFAGLITKNREVASRRVPYVSDIPIVGRLFRFDVETNRRTELLIFMTPHIVQEDAEYDWIKHVESERMSWCLSDVIEMHGNVGVSGGHGLWGPAPSPIIYPHSDPTGTGSETVPVPLPMDAQPVPGDVPPPAESSRRGSSVKSVKTWLGPPPPPSSRQAVHAAPPPGAWPGQPTPAAPGPQLGDPNSQDPEAQRAGYHPNPSPPGVAPVGYFGPGGR